LAQAIRIHPDDSKLYLFCVHLTQGKAAADQIWDQVREIFRHDASKDQRKLIEVCRSVIEAPAISDLPRNVEDRALWLLVDLVGLPLDQAGPRLGISEEEARARLYRIRKTVLNDRSDGFFDGEEVLEQRSKKLFTLIPEISPPAGKFRSTPNPITGFWVGGMVISALIGLFFLT
jgi:hypothetical protein